MGSMKERLHEVGQDGCACVSMHVKVGRTQEGDVNGSVHRNFLSTQRAARVRACIEACSPIKIIEPY